MEKDRLRLMVESICDLIAQVKHVLEAGEGSNEHMCMEETASLLTCVKSLEEKINLIHTLVVSTESGMKNLEKKINQIQDNVNKKFSEVSNKMPTYAEASKTKCIEETKAEAPKIKSKILVETSTQTYDMGSTNEEVTHVIPDEEEEQHKDKTGGDPDPIQGKENINPSNGISQPEEPEVFLLGDSNVRYIRTRYLFGKTNTQKAELRNKTLQGATKFIKSMKIKPKNILLQCGGNDVERNNIHQIRTDLKELLQTTKEKMSDGTDISLCIILHSNVNDYKRKQVEELAEKLCKDNGVRFISTIDICSEIEYGMFSDIRHLSRKGLGTLIRKYREVLPYFIPDKSFAIVSSSWDKTIRGPPNQHNSHRLYKYGQPHNHHNKAGNTTRPQHYHHYRNNQIRDHCSDNGHYRTAPSLISSHQYNMKHTQNRMNHNSPPTYAQLYNSYMIHTHNRYTPLGETLV